ncbi:MAG: acetyl-CoA carboxylase biotin carboxyl carrier protein subunit [Clostridiales bacterium]|nr:acetyl-CoA carboxylase biotin carboxyl carrier protein subunit [Clostridiales bacterium]
MKKYNVTVNGVTYEVLVEEADSASAEAVAPAPKAAAPKAAAQAPAPKAAPSGAQGGIKVTAPMPGTILKMNVKVGDTVKANDLVCVLEAMKMENEIFAKEGGVVKTVDAPQGSSVNSGDTIITLG